jgi:hypothetical protein
LPIGFRPEYTELFGTVSGNTAGRIDVSTNGNITANGPSTNGWVSLDGLSFMAYQ